MDGSPQCGSLHATTLWHSDAVERAPSTSSKTDITRCPHNVRFTSESGHRSANWVRFVTGAWRPITSRRRWFAVFRNLDQPEDYPSPVDLPWRPSPFSDAAFVIARP